MDAKTFLSGARAVAGHPMHLSAWDVYWKHFFLVTSGTCHPGERYLDLPVQSLCEDA